MMLPIIDVTIIAIILIFIINLGYKFLIKQEEAKIIKERQKELSKQSKEEQKKGNQQKSNELLNEMLKENGKLMKMTMKPMMVSMLLVILVLPWVASNYGDIYAPLNATSFSVQGKDVPIIVKDNSITIDNIEHNYNENFQFVDTTWKVHKTDKLEFVRVIALLPVSFPYVNDDLGWLGWYFVVSLPVMIVMRKLMGIYI